MRAADILELLPSELDWMVLFRLSAISSLATESEVRSMFRLPINVDLDPVSHIVLSSQGHLIASLNQSALWRIDEDELTELPPPRTSLLGAHRALFDNLDPNKADCLAFGKTSAPRPVILHIEMKADEGHATAIFHRQPSCRDYALLKAIGVEYLGGHWTDAGFVASFRNRLSFHLHAALLSGYTRPGNCNRFFLNHGEIDTKVQSGLAQACLARTEWAREKSFETARELARQACAQEVAMTCYPPPPRMPFPRGDLVPLGFLLNALAHDPQKKAEKERIALREKLWAAKRGPLWAFHTDRLVTCTDSALVLLGIQDRESIEALECFTDGNGAYFPQLWAPLPEPDRLVMTTANAHWCQADFATTCLVRSLRKGAGLSTVTPLEYLQTHFEVRSGLFFANPYLTDWALASALSADTGAAEVKDRLRKEILASRNSDYSFGAYDVAFSTSLAILALAALGCRGRLLRLSQLALIEMMDSANGIWPECTPFYSSKKVSDPEAKRPMAPDRICSRSQVIDVNGSIHELCWYVDTYRIISTAVALMALGEACDVLEEGPDLSRDEPVNKSYRCGSQAEYVAEVALHPYV